MKINVGRELTRPTQSVHAIRSGALGASGSFVAALGACGPEEVTWKGEEVVPKNVINRMLKRRWEQTYLPNTGTWRLLC